MARHDELERRIAEAKRENAEIEREIAEMKRRIDELEAELKKAFVSRILSHTGNHTPRGRRTAELMAGIMVKAIGDYAEERALAKTAETEAK